MPSCNTAARVLLLLSWLVWPCGLTLTLPPRFGSRMLEMREASEAGRGRAVLANQFLCVVR